jgi:hypothetical protein
MKPEIRYAPWREMRIKREDGEPPHITGYPIVFNSYSEDLGGFREMIMPEARQAVERGGDFVSMFNHDPNYVIGRQSAGTIAVSVDEVGVYLDATPPDTQWAHDLMVSIERGDVNGGSFQFWVRRDEWNADYTERKVYDFDLVELGPVTMPAYPGTSAQVRSLAQAGINYKRLAEALDGKDVEAIRALIEALQTQLPEIQAEDGAQTDWHGSVEILRKRLELVRI